MAIPKCSNSLLGGLSPYHILDIYIPHLSEGVVYMAVVTYLALLISNWATCSYGTGKWGVIDRVLVQY